MKNLKYSFIAILAALGFIFTGLSASAQSPDALNYQAAVRDGNGQIIANQSVSFRISVLLGSASGTPVYTETHTLSTNQFGLANLQIGTGTVVSGTFATIDWANGSHFLQVELDETGGSSYTLMGASELVSVPYALHARTVEIDQVDDADADATNELQTLSCTGADVTLSNGGGTVTVDVNDADADPSNELQTLLQSGSTVTLSNSGGTINIDDADADPANEFNTGLSMNGDSLTITDGGGTLQVDLSGLVDDGDWSRNGTLVYNDQDSIAIGTNGNGGLLAIGNYNANGIQNNNMDSLPNQVWIGGGINTASESQDVTKLMIGHYDNDGSVVYPIACKDENGNTDFYLKNRPSSSGIPFAYFGGNVGIGTETPAAFLDISPAASTTGNTVFSAISPSASNYSNSDVALIQSGPTGTFTGTVLTVQSRKSASSSFNLFDVRTGASGTPVSEFVINGNGRVGINTASPTSELGINGEINVVNSSNDVRVEIDYNSSSDVGYTNYFGPNSRNILLGFLNSSNIDNGVVAVYGSSTTAKAGVIVNGSGQGEVFGDVKNFRMAHPTKPGKEIWYASLEGPEAGAYVRGTGQLVNGEGVVEFPEHFELVANDQTMTVVLTPLSGQSEGLAVIEKTAQGFKVVELHGGTGSYEFDWEAKAVRQGYENYRVIRDSSEYEFLNQEQNENRK